MIQFVFFHIHFHSTIISWFVYDLSLVRFPPFSKFKMLLNEFIGIRCLYQKQLIWLTWYKLTREFYIQILLIFINVWNCLIRVFRDYSWFRVCCGLPHWLRYLFTFNWASTSSFKYQNVLCCAWLPQSHCCFILAHVGHFSSATIHFLPIHHVVFWLSRLDSASTHSLKTTQVRKEEKWMKHFVLLGMSFIFSSQFSL